jgi:hypothetical protein
MDEERRARREVISCEVMLVLLVRRRKSANHWGEAWRGDVGESMGLDAGAGEDEAWFGSIEDWSTSGVSLVDGLRNGCVNVAEA